MDYCRFFVIFALLGCMIRWIRAWLCSRAPIATNQAIVLPVSGKGSGLFSAVNIPKGVIIARMRSQNILRWSEIDAYLAEHTYLPFDCIVHKPRPRSFSVLLPQKCVRVDSPNFAMSKKQYLGLVSVATKQEAPSLGVAFLMQLVQQGWTETCWRRGKHMHLRSLRFSKKAPSALALSMY